MYLQIVSFKKNIKKYSSRYAAILGGKYTYFCLFVSIMTVLCFISPKMGTFF